MAFATIGTAGITDGAIATADIADNAVTSAKTSGIPARPNAKPIIINGNMAVAQRGTSFADVANGAYTLDRFRTSVSDDGAITITQEALTSGNAYNDGFKTALKCDVTTADTSMTGTQKFWVQQIIEAQNLQVLKYGTSSAEKITLAFWVKATKTGTNVVRLYAFDDDRSVSASYTISQSDTWEHKVLNIPADTTGVIDNNNEPGIQISWALAAGADFQSGTLATTWGANTTANDFVGQVNHMDSTSNNFHITGIQLEVGEYTSSTLPPFQHESYGDNLARCQRYFEKTSGGRKFDISSAGGNQEAVAIFKTQKRANPTIATISTTENCCSSVGNDVGVGDQTLSCRVVGTSIVATGTEKFFFAVLSADAEL
jgi:hypothetical protein